MYTPKILVCFLFLCFLQGIVFGTTLLDDDSFDYDRLDNLYINVSVPWDGNWPTCGPEECNGYQWVPSFACNKRIGFTQTGNWENGTKYFSDPMHYIVAPSEKYVLTSVSIVLSGVFNCKLLEHNKTFTSFYVTLQDTMIHTWTLPENKSCLCLNCVSEIEYDSIIYDDGWPSYNYSSINKLSVVVTESVLCLNNIQLTLVFSKIENTVSDKTTVAGRKYIIIGICTGGGFLIILGVIITVLLINKRPGNSSSSRRLRSDYTAINDGNEASFQIHPSTPKQGRPVQGINFEIKGDEIKLGPRIGKGSYGEVFRAEWRGILVAVKKLPLSLLQDQVFLKDFNQEASIMSSLRHPNVLQFLGTCVINNDIAILTEYMNRGSLYRLLHDTNFDLTWSLIKRFAIETAQGMLYLHESSPPVLHRDLKSHNLLVDSSFKVKISDFGLSKVLDHLNKTMTSCGTAAWAAPEVLRNSRYTEKADVYSYGVCLWEFYTRLDPYEGMPTFQIIFAVGTEGLRPTIPDSCPSDYKALIQECWDIDPQKRPSFGDIIKRIKLMQ